MKCVSCGCDNTESFITVDINGGGDYESIQDAIDAANEGAIIDINSGTYNEVLNINKKITLKGDDNEKPIISIDSGNVCTITEDASISNLIFSNTSDSANDEVNLVEISSDCKLKECDITKSVGNGLAVKGSANPDFECCTFTDNDDVGIKLFDNSTGTFFECESSSNGGGGIIIKDNANPQLEACYVLSNDKFGIYCTDTSKGTVNVCSIDEYGGENEGLVIDGNASPTIESSGFYDNKSVSIHIKGNATPSFDNCEFGNNSGACMLVEEEANPVVNGCSLDDNKETVLIISGNATGTYTDCYTYSNETNNPAIIVKDSANPKLSGFRISDNQGGAILIKDNATGEYKNCTLSDNGPFNFKNESSQEPSFIDNNEEE